MEENLMNLLKDLFSSRDKPQNRVGSSFSFLFGGTTSGKAVNERTAMQTTAVYACVRILAESIAGLPLHVYKYRSDGGKERIPFHPLYHLYVIIASKSEHPPASRITFSI